MKFVYYFFCGCIGVHWPKRNPKIAFCDSRQSLSDWSLSLTILKSNCWYFFNCAFNMCNPYLSNTTMKTAIVQLLYYERIIEISVQIHNSALLLKLQDKGCVVLAPLFLSLNVCWAKLSITVWKVYLFRIFLVRNFPHLDWIRTRKTPNTDIFYAVYELFKFWCQFKKELIYPKSQIDTNLFAESNFVKTQNTAEVLFYEICFYMRFFITT